MAKRRYRNPRYRRRRRYRRRKKLVPRSMVSYNGVKNFKLRLSTQAITNSAGELTWHINCNSLSKAVSLPTGDVALLEVGNLKGLFDQYRVRAVKVKWIPTVLGGNQDPTSTVGDQNMLIMCYDPDNTGGLLGSEMLTRDRVRFRGAYKQWTYYQKINKAIQGPIGTAGNLILPGGWMNLQTEGGNQAGIMAFDTAQPYTKGNGTPLGNRPVANIIVTYYLQCKIRQ